MKKTNQSIEDHFEKDVNIEEKEMQLAWNEFDDLKDEYPEPNLNSMWKRINVKLGWKKRRSLISFNNKIIRYAAVILPILIIASILYFSTNKISEKLDYITYTAPDGLRSKVILSDGSTIWLQPKSQIKYPEKFTDDSREIYFSGQAYFSIHENPESQFIVHLSNMDVSVFGTQFYLKANLEDDFIETALISGKVKISGSTIEKYLNPGEVVVFSKSKNEISETKNLNTNTFHWENGNKIFDNCEFMNVLKDISEWYNFELDLELDSDLILNTKITLTIREESIHEIMEILKVVVPFEYKIDGDKITAFKRY